MFPLPQIGSVELITVRPAKDAPVQKLDSSIITIDNGLEGDYKTGKDGKRLITLFQFEHLTVISSILGKTVLPEQVRRNLFVSKINLLALHEKTFKIGNDIVLKGTGYCVPCQKMEENLRAGGYWAMAGHGGLTATVIEGGEISLNDKVILLA